MPSVRNIRPEVKEIPCQRHGRPAIKDGAVHVYDHVLKQIYVYGGVPWDGNPDVKSPTRQASNSFWSYDIEKMLWQDHSNSLYHHSTPFRDPFKFTEYEVEDPDLDELSKDAGLPRLYGASGIFVHNSNSGDRYVVLVGENRTDKQMSLFCVDMTYKKWMSLRLHGNAKGNIRHATQIAASGLRKGGTVRLHVFGGISADGREYCNDHLVIDLNSRVWIPKGPVLADIMHLGCSPAALVIPGETGQGVKKDKILLLRGHEENLGVTFTNVLLMDAESDSVPIEVYEPDGPKPAPLTTYYMHNLPDSITPTSRKWLLIGWIDSDERDITEHEEYNFDIRDKTTLHLVFWQLAAKLVKPTIEESRPAPRRISQEVIPETESESESSSEGPLPARQTAKRSKPFSHRPSVIEDENQRDTVTTSRSLPRRSGEPTPGEAHVVNQGSAQDASVKLTWEKLSIGPVAKAIESLDEYFCVEYAVPLDEDTTSSLVNQMSPSILLLGYSPKFTGEVKAHCYNAYAVIPLERDDIELCDESDSDSTMSGESYRPPVEDVPSSDIFGSAENQAQEGSVDDGVSPFDADAPVNGLHRSVQGSELQQGPMYTMDIDNLVPGRPDENEDYYSASGSDLVYPSEESH